MASLGIATFESGSLTGANGYSATSGAENSLETTAPILGTYSHRLTNAGSSYGRLDFSSTSEVYAACYIRIDNFPAVDTYIINTRTNFSNAVGVRLTTTGQLQLDRGGSYIGSPSVALTTGQVYRVELAYSSPGNLNLNELRLAEGDGAAVVIAATFAANYSPTHVRFGSQSSSANLSMVLDECHVDDAAYPVLPPLPSDGSAEIEAETLLQLTASATIEAPAPASIAATTYLELTTGLSLETPAHIAASALLELTASATVSVTSATLVGGEALLQLVATADVQQDHLITAETYLQLVATANLQLDDATLVAGSALLELVGTLATATEHHVRPEALLQLVATTAIAQEHLLRGTALLQLVAHEGYTGPGTGIVVPGARFSPNTLREGDTFRVVLPWAGISGMTGLAHVNSRTLRDDRRDQDVALAITPHDTANVARLAGGATPTPEADQTDAARRLARTEREQDKLERTRNR